MRAVNPKEMPPMPDGAKSWARSTKRADGMYHAHFYGFAVCGFVLERNRSEEANTLGDMQYWGLCPRCYAKATKS